MAERRASRFSIRTGIALVAVLACVVSFLFAVQPAFAADDNYPKDAAVDISWYDDSQTVFAISTPEQLAGLAYLVSVKHYTFAGKGIALTNDIDLSGICSGGVNWRPIGTAYTGGASFSGVFDGQGHTVSGLLIDDSGYYNALFGSIRGALIQDLTVSGAVYGSEYVGGIVSMCSDSDLVNLTNECYVDAVKYNAGTAHEGRAAGVVCYAATSYPSGDHYFQNLVNEGNVVSTSYYTAGVIGFLYNSNGYTTYVSHCANTGSVDVSAARYGLDDANKAVGGVLGSTAGNYGTYVVAGCVNSGDVSAANCLSTGGVAGYLGGNDSSVMLSENTGSVNGANNAGGVLGFLGSQGGSIRSTLNVGSVNGGQSGGVVGAASNRNQQYSNNFILEGTASAGYGFGVSAEAEGVVRTAESMRKQRFLDTLNDGSTEFSIVGGDNGGMPILAWTNPAAVPGKGGEPDDEDPPKDETDPDAEVDQHAGEGDQTDRQGQNGLDAGVSGEHESDYANPAESGHGVSARDVGANDPTADTGLKQDVDESEDSIEPASEGLQQPQPDIAAERPETEPDAGTSNSAQAEQPQQQPEQQPEQPPQQQELDDEPKKPSEDQPPRTSVQMVEVAATPEDYLAVPEDKQDASQLVRMTLAAAGTLCLGAGLVCENVSFSRALRKPRDGSDDAEE